MIICVCGPTGIGKTILSETLAEKFDAILQLLEMTSRMKDFYDIKSTRLYSSKGEEKRYAELTQIQE